MIKMTLLIFYFLFYFINFPLICQSKSEQLREIEKIKKHAIKSLIVVKYSYSFEGKLSQKGYKETEIFYDTDGKKISEKIYYSDTSIAYNTTYVYDDNGIEIRKYWENVSGNKFKVLHEYDSKGFLKESIGYDEQKSQNSKYTYEYDGSGMLIKKISHYRSTTYTYHYKYDKEGKLIEEFAELPNSGLGNQTTLYEYDDIGLLRGAMIYDNVGDPVAKLLYTYEYFTK